MSEKSSQNIQVNLIALLNNQDYESLNNYILITQENLIMEWYNTQSASILRRTLRYYESILKHYKKHMDSSSREYSIFQLGSLMGTVDIFERLFHEKQQDEMTANLYKKQVSSIKHLEDIILLLESHGIMTHSEICENLSLKESTLSELMKKVNLTALITSTKSGKYKLYRLSDAGRRLGKQLRSQKSVLLSQEDLLKQVKTYLESPQTDDSFKDKLRDLLLSEDNTFTEKATLTPGSNLTVHYYDKKHKRADYEVTGILKTREGSTDVTIMANQKNYGFDDIYEYDDTDIFNEKEYA